MSTDRAAQTAQRLFDDHRGGVALTPLPEELRPRKDQPFYHLLAQNAQTTYVAYVSEQNLLPDAENGPIGHPQVKAMFEGYVEGRYVPRRQAAN